MVSNNNPPYFPLFISLKGKKILVVGGGTIGTRRVKGLLSCWGEVTLISPSISDELEKLIKEKSIVLTWINRKITLKDLQKDYFMVIAATSDERVNEMVAEWCLKQNIFVSCASDREYCSFYFPGLIFKDDITIGVTGNGYNHREVKEECQRIRKETSNGRDN